MYIYLKYVVIDSSNTVDLHDIARSVFSCSLFLHFFVFVFSFLPFLLLFF